MDTKIFEKENFKAELSDFGKKLGCTMLICVMLNLSFASAAAMDFSGETGSGQQGNGTGDWDANAGLQDYGIRNPVSFSIALADAADSGNPGVDVVANDTEFACSTPESDPSLNVLSPEEVAALRRTTEIENKGFDIDSINSGRGPNTDRGELKNDVIVQTLDDGSAVANELPSTKMDTGEFSQLFNQYINGPFAFGVSLDDTIRIGQCRYPDRLNQNDRECPVEDRAQSYRNGGAGVVADVKLVWSDLKDWIGIDAVTGNTGQYTTEQLENLQSKVVLEDENSLQTKTYNRETKLLTNTVKTEDFDASMATSGSSSAGLISIYSSFDKYFNSWFSTEMVISNFGPTLIGQAKKYAGWAKRRGWAWDTTDSKFMQWFRRTFYDPESLLGEARLKQIVNRSHKYGFGDFMTKGIEATGEWDSGYAFVKGGGWRKWLNEAGKPGGYFDQMTDPVIRGQFFEQVSDLRQVAHTNRAIYKYYDDAYREAVRKFGAVSPEAKAALIDSARSNSRIMLAMDDDWLRLDATELWLKEEVTGFYNKGLKVKATGNFVPMTGDSKPMGKIQQAFAETGLFDGTDFATNADGFLEIYKISDKGEFIGDVGIEDLRKNFSRYIDKAVQTEKGDFIKLDATSLDYIAQESPLGKVKVYKADWVLDHVEAPEMYASRMKNTRADRIANTFSQNMDRVHSALIERNFAGQSRRYYSVLDKAFAQEQELLKSYFSIKGGAKWTLMPFLYWGGKKGYGFEALSAYQLPDLWQEVKLSTEDEEIFDDAFIDVFAQEGSDEGDIFAQVLNKLPWKMVLDKISENYNPVDNAYSSITNPLSGWRREVENVGYFTYTNPDCATCGAVLRPMADSEQALAELQQKGRGQAEISFNVQDEMNSYFVEDVLTDKAKEDGTTLIAFGHHTNIDGTKISEDSNEKPIDLIEAKKDKTRCQDAVKEIGLGFLGDNPQRAGAILAFGETLGYAVFLWAGIMGSVIQQTLLVPELQDCVDDVEGYYVHMFSPYDEKKETVETTNEGASKQAGNVVQLFNETVLGKAPAAEKKADDEDKPPVDEAGQPYTAASKTQGQKDNAIDAQNALKKETTAQKSIFEQAKETVTSQAETLGQKAQSKEILQMEIATRGKTDGTVSFEKSFFIWFKGYTQQAVWDNKSKYVLGDSKNKVEVTIDKENSAIVVQKEGKPAETVIQGDQANMTSIDGRVPAVAVPQRIGRISLPSDAGIELFSMDYQGNFDVLERSVLDCIRANVLQQTGVAMTTNDITEAFGQIEAIVTDSYSSIVPSTSEKSITANGSPRETVYGAQAELLILSGMKASLLDGTREIPVGNFRSAQFKNGVILYKPATAQRPAELVIWLRYHQRSILRNSDVTGLKATLADPIINPETGCPETAIDLAAIPNLAAGSDSQITERVENFNTAMKKMGPFQTFETEGHKFIFYSQKTSDSCSPSDPGCCQQRVTIIDKKTGDVYDQAIVGDVKQTPTGISFETADGKSHTLDFSADNGIPKISYNGLAPETIMSAKGSNGGFWYDSENGLWYPYNAQLLPMSDEYKKGFDTRHREDCSSSTLPGGNVMNLQVGGTAETPFNLPSLPEEPVSIMLFLGSLLAAICISRHLIEKKIRT